MSCQKIRIALEEGHLSQEVASHLQQCSACAAHAQLLAALEKLEEPAGPPTPGLVEKLPHPSWLFRLPATYLPLLLGLGFLGVGLGTLPSWPSGQELALLWQALSETTGYALGEATARVVVAASRQAGWWLPALGLGLTGLLLLRWVRRTAT